jgi:hypothetical protein
MKGSSDTVDVYKVKDKILIKMNKIKATGKLEFKTHPTCIVLKSNEGINYKDLIHFMGQEYSSVSSFHNTILEA